MKRTKVTFQVHGIALPRAIAADLRGKQSVRATFKLPEHTINTVSIVAAHLGIKQKSLFDHLMDDLDVLKSIASGIGGVDNQVSEKIQKTFVISRKSLDYLESISNQFQVPRDLLVEFSVERLLPIIEKERLKTAKRRDVLGHLQQYLQEGNNLLKKSIGELGEDDMTTDLLFGVLSSAELASKQLDILVKKGDIIEELLKGLPK